MSTLIENEKTAHDTELPRWQQLTGLTPEREAKMSDDERDAAVRVLVKEVEAQAEAEFERGEQAPKGERTVFWDPLEKICRVLGISRTKLSRYSRELNGLRAIELMDRIKARKYMPARIEFWVVGIVSKIFARLEDEIDPELMENEEYRLRIEMQVRRKVRDQRKGVYRGRWAVLLGFPNAARISKACLTAFGRSMDDLEAELVHQLVQMFFKKMAEKAAAAEPAKHREHAGEKDLAKTEVARSCDNVLAGEERDKEVEELRKHRRRVIA